jgi:hypothetical protein
MKQWRLLGPLTVSVWCCCPLSGSVSGLLRGDRKSLSLLTFPRADGLDRTVPRSNAAWQHTIHALTVFGGEAGSLRYSTTNPILILLMSWQHMHCRQESFESYLAAEIIIRRTDYATPLYPQTLVLTSPTSGGRSVVIVRPRTQATEFVCWLIFMLLRCGEGVNVEKTCSQHPYY